MLKGLGVSLLTPILDQWFHDIDKSKIQVSVTSGSIQLSDLSIRETVLRDLGLPLTIKWGLVGNLSLNIGWKQLFKKPVVITASEVFVLVDMPSDSVRDREALQRYAVVVKKRMVERLTEHLNSYSSSNSDASSSRMTLLQRMLFQGEVSIQAVHIRFEDALDANGLRPVAGGVKLDELHFGRNDGVSNSKPSPATAPSVSSKKNGGGNSTSNADTVFTSTDGRDGNDLTGAGDTTGTSSADSVELGDADASMHERNSDDAVPVFHVAKSFHVRGLTVYWDAEARPSIERCGGVITSGVSRLLRERFTDHRIRDDSSVLLPVSATGTLSFGSASFGSVPSSGAVADSTSGCEVGSTSGSTTVGASREPKSARTQLHPLDVAFSLDFDPIFVSLSSYQYHGIIQFTQKVAHAAHAAQESLVTPLRPHAAVGTATRRWFVYAAYRVLQASRGAAGLRGMQWPRTKLFCAKRREYMDIYTRYVTATNSGESSRELDAIEASLSAPMIVLFRRLCERRLAHEGGKHSADVGVPGVRRRGGRSRFAYRRMAAWVKGSVVAVNDSQRASKDDLLHQLQDMAAEVDAWNIVCYNMNVTAAAVTLALRSMRGTANAYVGASSGGGRERLHASGGKRIESPGAVRREGSGTINAGGSATRRLASLPILCQVSLRNLAFHRRNRSGSAHGSTHGTTVEAATRSGDSLPLPSGRSETSSFVDVEGVVGGVVAQVVDSDGVLQQILFPATSTVDGTCTPTEEPADGRGRGSVDPGSVDLPVVRLAQCLAAGAVCCSIDVQRQRVLLSATGVCELVGFFQQDTRPKPPRGKPDPFVPLHVFEATVRAQQQDRFTTRVGRLLASHRSVVVHGHVELPEILLEIPSGRNPSEGASIPCLAVHLGDVDVTCTTPLPAEIAEIADPDSETTPTQGTDTPTQGTVTPTQGTETHAVAWSRISACITHANVRAGALATTAEDDEETGTTELSAYADEIDADFVMLEPTTVDVHVRREVDVRDGSQELRVQVGSTPIHITMDLECIEGLQALRECCQSPYSAREVVDGPEGAAAAPTYSRANDFHYIPTAPTAPYTITALRVDVAFPETTVAVLASSAVLAPTDDGVPSHAYGNAPPVVVSLLPWQVKYGNAAPWRVDRGVSAMDITVPRVSVAVPLLDGDCLASSDCVLVIEHITASSLQRHYQGWTPAFTCTGLTTVGMLDHTVKDGSVDTNITTSVQSVRVHVDWSRVRVLADTLASCAAASQGLHVAPEENPLNDSLLSLDDTGETEAERLSSAATTGGSLTEKSASLTSSITAGTTNDIGNTEELPYTLQFLKQFYLLGNNQRSNVVFTVDVNETVVSYFTGDDDADVMDDACLLVQAQVLKWGMRICTDSHDATEVFVSTVVKKMVITDGAVGDRVRHTSSPRVRDVAGAFKIPAAMHLQSPPTANEVANFIECQFSFSRQVVLVEGTDTVPADVQKWTTNVPACVYMVNGGSDVALLEYASIEEAADALNAIAVERKNVQACWGPSASTSIKGFVGPIECTFTPNYASKVQVAVQRDMQRLHLSTPTATNIHSLNTRVARGRAISELSLQTVTVDAEDSVASVYNGLTTDLYLDLKTDPLCVTVVCHAPFERSHYRCMEGRGSVQFRFRKRGDLHHTRVYLVDCQVTSFPYGNKEAAGLAVLSPFSMFGTLKTSGNDSISCSVDLEALKISVCRSDMRLLELWHRIHEANVTNEQSRVLWSQATRPVQHRNIAVSVRPGGARMYSQCSHEQCIVRAKYINVYFVDESLNRFRPMLLGSVSLESDVQNWSTDLHAYAFADVACAAFDVKRMSWEPVLLAPPDANDQVQPWSVRLNAVTQPSEWLGNGRVTATSQNKSSHKKSRKTSGCLLDGRADTFWDGGVAKGDNWMLFEFHRVVTLKRLKYTTRKNVLGNATVPKACRLEVGESLNGPFVHVVEWQGSLGSTVAYSPSFSGSGKFWKWTIHSRYGSVASAANVVSVEFAQRAGGTIIEIRPENVAEVTLSTEFLLRLHALSANWQAEAWRTPGEGPQEDQREDVVDEPCPPSSTFVGSHQLVNMTGTPIAVVQGPVFIPTAAREVAHRARLSLHFANMISAHDTVVPIDKRVPITHIDVINVEAGEKAPRGWTTLKKNIHYGGNGSGALKGTRFLIYKRDFDAPPIIDLHIRCSGGASIQEQKPHGYEQIVCSVSGNTENTGPSAFLCYKRGYGAPLLDICLVYGDDEDIPIGFTPVARPVNLDASRPVYLAYKRQEAHFIPMDAPSTQPASAAVPLLSSALRAADVHDRLNTGSTRQGEAAIGGVVLHDTFLADACITDIAVVSHGRPVKTMSQLAFPFQDWTPVTRKGDLFDVVDGHAKPTYVLYKCGSSRVPITAVRTAFGPTPTGATATGWERLQPALNIDNKVGLPPAWLEVRRDVGAPPLVRLDFICADVEPVPAGMMVLDYAFCGASKRRIFKKRDIRMVYSVGDVPPQSISLKGTDVDAPSTAAMTSTLVLDSGVVRLGTVDDGVNGGDCEKHVIVETNVTIPLSLRPEVTATACDESHKPICIPDNDFCFRCTVINEHSVSISVQRESKKAGWSNNLFAKWTICAREVPKRASSSALSRTLSYPEAKDTTMGLATSEPALEAVEVVKGLAFKIPQIAFEVRGYLPVSHVEVHQGGTKNLVLTPCQSDARKIRVAVSVEIHNDMRVISVSSPLVLKSNLNTSIQVCFQQSMHDETVLATLEKGGVFALPLGMMDTLPSAEDFLPLLRFWSAELNTPYYTTNPLDIEVLATTDWVQQCSIGYIYRNPVPGTVPLWVREPMDFLDTNPGLTTNRRPLKTDKKWKPLTVTQLGVQGYRVVGYVYSREAVGCKPLHTYRDLRTQHVFFTIDGNEFASQARQPTDKDNSATYVDYGIECYLPVHHGMVRIRPVPRGNGVTKRREEWHWSKEILRLGRNALIPERNLLCTSKTTQQCKVFDCCVRSRLNSVEWTLDSNLYVCNALPHEIFIAFTSSGDDPPGSNSIPIAPGQQLGSFPAIMYSQDTDSSAAHSTDYDSQYKFLEQARREAYLWISLRATRKCIDRTVVGQGIVKVGSHNTDAFLRKTPQRQSSYPVKVIEVPFTSTVASELLAQDALRIDVRQHHSMGQGNTAEFHFNTKILSDHEFAIQILRTDKSTQGWEEDLEIAWEAWADAKWQEPDDSPPQVALRDWSQPTKLTWERTVDTDSGADGQQLDAIYANFEGTGTQFSRSMQLGIYTSRQPGAPIVYTVYAKNLIANTTMEEIDVLDPTTATSQLWYPETHTTRTTGLYSPKADAPLVLSMVLSAEKVIHTLDKTPKSLSLPAYRFTCTNLNLGDVSGVERVVMRMDAEQAKEFLPPASSARSATKGTAAGSASTDCPQLELELQWGWGSAMKLWKTVTVCPSLVFCNNTTLPLLVGYPTGAAADPAVLATLEKFSESPVLNSRSRRYYVVRHPTTTWTVAFCLDDPRAMSTTLKVSREDGSLLVLELDITGELLHRTVTVSWSLQPPFRVENHCKDAVIRFHQETHADDKQSARPPQQYLLFPGLAMPFAFDRCVHQALRVNVEDAFVHDRTVSRLGKVVEVQLENPVAIEYTFVTESQPRIAHVLIFDEGKSRVILFSDSIEEARRAYGVPETLPDELLQFDFLAVIPGIGVSVVDSTPGGDGSAADSGKESTDDLSTTQELFYLAVNGISVNVCKTTAFTKRYVSVADIELYHQKQGTLTPLVLSRVKVKDDGANGTTAVVQMCRVSRLGQLGWGRGFTSDRYVAFDVQSLALHIDDDLLKSVQRLVALYQACNAQYSLHTVGKTVGYFLSEHATRYDQVQVFPLEILLTTSLEDLGGALDARSSGAGAFLKRVLVAAVGKVHDLPFRLAGLEVRDVTIAKRLLRQQIYRHFWSQALRFMTIHNIVSSTGVLNSMAIIGDVGSSIRSLGGSFVELSEKKSMLMVVDTDENLGSKVQRGSQQVASNVLGGVSGVAGGLGSGLAALSMDETYRKDRRKNLSVKPASLRSGILTGVSQLGRGVLSGAIGLVEQPIRGGVRGGLVGGIGGLGRGIAGLVIKPVSGAMDMVQSSLAGIETLTGISAQPVGGTVRDPRYSDPEGRVTPYSWHKSMGRRFMKEFFDGKYADHGYISHVSEEVSGGTVRMIFVQRKSVIILKAEGKGTALKKKIEKEIDSQRLEGLSPVPGSGIELWCTGSGAVMIHCSGRNIDRLSVLLSDLIALHQRSRRTRIVTGSLCYFSADGTTPTAHHTSPSRFSGVVPGLRTSTTDAQTGNDNRPEMVLREVWENERCYPWVGFSHKLLPTDRGTYSSYDGKVKYGDMRVIRPTPGWQWVGTWQVQDDNTVGENGWTYAVDFPGTYSSHYNKLMHFVRRRRWIRRQQRVADPTA